MASFLRAATLKGMSSLYLSSPVGPLQSPAFPQVRCVAAEAFDDEPFSMNVTVDEAAVPAAHTIATEAAVDCDHWAWAS